MTPSDDDTEPGDGSRRRADVVLAGHAGDVDAVAAAASDPSPAVRAAAIGATARLVAHGTVDPAVLDTAVERGLADPDPAVRRRAAAVAARAEVGPAVRDALVRALEDDEWPVAEAAAFACGELVDAGDEVVAALVAMATGHEDALCREAAVAALGSIGDQAALPAVLAACGDRATVRRRAVLALAAFDGPEVTAALERLTGDRDLQVRQAAEELLGIETGEPT
jgi:HEAT repeat protein